jgi:hypothetical protein
MRTSINTLTLLIGLSFHHTYAQKRPDLKGEYHLQGVMETASALLLKPDSTFELFFSYGAIDRQGKGKWTYTDGKVRLQSRIKPKVDFTLVGKNSTNDSTTIVKIVTPGSQFTSSFEVLLRSADGDQIGKTNNEGVYRTKRIAASSIELFFEFSPERYSTFSVDPNENYFEFKIEPWIIEIFADNIELAVTKDGLVGQHPLLKGDAFLYTRTK